MKCSKEEKNKLNNDLTNKLAEIENLKRISMLELEKLPNMKDEYKRILTERGAEKSKLASDAAWMREQVELKLTEIEKLKDLITGEKLNFQMESRDAKENFDKQIANLQERNKKLEDENAKFATKVLSLKEALNTNRKEKKDKRVQELEIILNDANQLLKKVQEKYYEKSQEQGFEQLKDVLSSKQMHPNFKPTCSKNIHITKKCHYNECCSKFKDVCKEDNGLDFCSKNIDSYHRKMCFHTRPTIKSSSNFPINLCCSRCVYQHIPKCLESNTNFSLKSHLKNLT